MKRAPGCRRRGVRPRAAPEQVAPGAWVRGCAGARVCAGYSGQEGGSGGRAAVSLPLQSPHGRGCSSSHIPWQGRRMVALQGQRKQAVGQTYHGHGHSDGHARARARAREPMPPRNITSAIHKIVKSPKGGTCTGRSAKGWPRSRRGIEREPCVPAAHPALLLEPLFGSLRRGPRG